MAELRRLLFSPKQLVTLLMLAVINLALFSGYCRSTAEEQKSFRAMQDNVYRSAAQAEAEYDAIDAPEDESAEAEKPEAENNESENAKQSRVLPSGR